MAKNTSCKFLDCIFMKTVWHIGNLGRHNIIKMSYFRILCFLYHSFDLNLFTVISNIKTIYFPITDLNVNRISYSIIYGMFFLLFCQILKIMSYSVDITGIEMFKLKYLVSNQQSFPSIWFNLSLLRLLVLPSIFNCIKGASI